jgi:hypothetical protein
VLTAELTPEAKRQALADGATDFLTKPLDVTEVRLRFRNLLHMRALHLHLWEQNANLETLVQECAQALAERTAELEEARTQVLTLYRELARRNQDLQDMLGQVLQTPDDPADRLQHLPSDPTLHRASWAHRECEWKRGGPCGVTQLGHHVGLDKERPSHGRLLDRTPRVHCDGVRGFGGIQVTYQGACIENAQVSPLMFHIRPGPSTGQGSGLGAQVAGVSG